MAEEMITIPKWRFEQIQNSLRITVNAYKMRSKESCCFREMCKSLDVATSALEEKQPTTESGLHLNSVSNRTLCTSIMCTLAVCNRDNNERKLKCPL